MLQILKKACQNYLVIRVVYVNLSYLDKQDTAIRYTASTGGSVVAANRVVGDTKAVIILDDDNGD